MRRFFAAFGPGVVTGAADDDPSGIATYSIAGARFGTSLLWCASVTWPLMAAVQLACARIGMVTGQGLGAALKKKFPRPVLAGVVASLFIANTINVAADLSGMADAAETLSGVDSHVFVVVFGVAIAWATIRLKYAQIAMVLKWLALALFAYVITAVHLGPDWPAVFRAALVPSLPKGSEGWGMLVAILGTTISPYLFFWQASQEVEEEKLAGRKLLSQRRGATARELQDRRLDVGVGTFFSNLVMFFIILTTALTLHKNGMTEPESSREVAEALRPLAGRFTQVLYTVGLIGVGFLAIPTLAGSAAYAAAEIFGWKEGLDRGFRGARAFYAVVAVSTALGVCLDFLDVNPVKALYWSAVVNGLLAPFLLLGILLVATDRELMQDQPVSKASLLTVAAATLLMFGAAIGMFLF